MKTVRIILLALIITLVIGHSAFAESTESTQPSNERSFLGRIIDGLVESTQETRAVQKQLTTEQHQVFLEKHADAVQPNAEFVKVLEAKGFGAKMSQIWENIKEGARTAGENEQIRRSELDSKMTAINPHIRVKKNI